MLSNHDIDPIEFMKRFQAAPPPETFDKKLSKALENKSLTPGTQDHFSEDTNRSAWNFRLIWASTLAAGILLIAGLYLWNPNRKESAGDPAAWVEEKCDLSDCRFIGIKELQAEISYMDNGQAKYVKLAMGSIFRGLKVVLFTKRELILQSAYGTRYRLEAMI